MGKCSWVAKRIPAPAGQSVEVLPIGLPWKSAIARTPPCPPPPTSPKTPSRNRAGWRIECRVIDSSSKPDATLDHHSPTAIITRMRSAIRTGRRAHRSRHHVMTRPRRRTIGTRRRNYATTPDGSATALITDDISFPINRSSAGTIPADINLIGIPTSPSIRTGFRGGDAAEKRGGNGKDANG